jgi:hypothetical protein
MSAVIATLFGNTSLYNNGASAVRGNVAKLDGVPVVGNRIAKDPWERWRTWAYEYRRRYLLYRILQGDVNAK